MADARSFSVLPDTGDSESLRTAARSPARARSAERPEPLGLGPLRTIPEWKVWHEMIRRCADPTDPNYGGRGIKVCQRWLDSFEAFLADMGPRPAGVGRGGRSLYSIERKDNAVGYEPSNCVWATTREQASNRRQRAVKLVSVAGERLTRKAAIERAGLTKQAVAARMKRGMTFEQAVLAKRDPRGRPKKAS